jgi:NADPH-dependent glutamate synthase beta subunit-like oxidoreductase
VIGGGLTAIDTATEIFPYYCLQIEKFNKFYRAIIEHFGDDYMANLLSEKDKIRAKRWLNHFEEWKTISEISDPELFVQKRIEFLKQCQGVTVLYRNNLTDSPAYRLNTHEVDNAFKEGSTFLECSHSLHFEVDSLNQVKGIVIEQQGERRKIDALSVFIACGTHANTSLRYDIKESELDLKNNQFKFIEGIDPCFLISLDDNKKGISVFGDQHPHFSGSVVKAMASAKQGAPLISNVLT